MTEPMETPVEQEVKKKRVRPASVKFFAAAEAARKRLAANAAKGEALDPALQEEVALLLAEAPDSETKEFLLLGLEIQRDINFQKTSAPEGFERNDLEYAKQPFSEIDMDWLCAFEFIRASRSTHLSPSLVAFEIKILESVLSHFVNTRQELRYKEIIVSELSARQEGVDTYIPPKPPPAPKPKTVTQVPEPRLEVSDKFIAGSSADDPRKYADALSDAQQKAAKMQEEFDAEAMKIWQKHSEEL